MACRHTLVDRRAAVIAAEKTRVDERGLRCLPRCALGRGRAPGRGRRTERTGSSDDIWRKFSSAWCVNECRNVDLPAFWSPMRTKVKTLAPLATEMA